MIVSLARQHMHRMQYFGGQDRKRLYSWTDLEEQKGVGNWAKYMIHLLPCWLHKHEELSFYPQHPCKYQAQLQTTVIPA